MKRILMVVLMLGICIASQVEAQRRGGGFGRELGDPTEYWMPPYHPGNIPYDGRFVFPRIQYSGYFAFGGEGPGWSHDFPEAERNFMKILRELTNIKPHMERSLIIRLDDPELFKHPFIYFSEPGGWYPNDQEVAGLRAYLLKGGFLTFDDMRDQHIYNMAFQLKKVLPDHDVLPLPFDHPVFDSFFTIANPGETGSSYGRPEFYAIFEGNDPAKRIMVLVNQNNDMGENWQWSERGFRPIQQTNESYKLGINYIIYSMTR